MHGHAEDIRPLLPRKADINDSPLNLDANTITMGLPFLDDREERDYGGLATSRLLFRQVQIGGDMVSGSQGRRKNAAVHLCQNPAGWLAVACREVGGGD